MYVHYMSLILYIKLQSLTDWYLGKIMSIRGIFTAGNCEDSTFLNIYPVFQFLVTNSQTCDVESCKCSCSDTGEY